jgi:hypothetical protein
VFFLRVPDVHALRIIQQDQQIRFFLRPFLARPLRFGEHQDQQRQRQDFQ